MHQHVQHDIFRHATGEIVDRDAHQWHLRQGPIGHERIDAGAEVEDHLQIRKRRELARNRLPDRGIMDLGGVVSRFRSLQDAPVTADLVEAGLPSFSRPVLGPAADQ